MGGATGQPHVKIYYFGQAAAAWPLPPIRSMPSSGDGWHHLWIGTARHAGTRSQTISAAGIANRAVVPLGIIRSHLGVSQAAIDWRPGQGRVRPSSSARTLS